MNNIDENLLVSDDNLCKNIDMLIPTNRGLIAQNLMNSLRTFIDAIIIKIYYTDQSITDDTLSYEDLSKPAVAYINNTNKYISISKFRKYLGGSMHFTERQDAAETLIIKHYKYLLTIKKEIKKRFGIVLLRNLSKFPINADKHIEDYYKKISSKIENVEGPINKRFSNRYYIFKKKAFFINEEIYYEIAFNDAEDHSSKFNTIIAYTKEDIVTNYAVKFEIKDSLVEVFGMETPIFIITKWETSIRPCEFENMLKLFDAYRSIESSHAVYVYLMRYLTQERVSLTHIIEYNDEDFMKFKGYVIKSEKNILAIVSMLQKARNIINNNRPGCNILRYLFFNMKNSIIKDQFNKANFNTDASGFEKNNFLSWLKLTNKAIPFDEMPFATSLHNHNPRFSDLLQCINTEGREHEFLGRAITRIVEEDRVLFVKKSDLLFDDIDILINKFNGFVEEYQNSRKILEFNDYLYIVGYEQNTVDIINSLLKYTEQGIQNYKNSANYWINSHRNIVISPEKDKALLNLFSDSTIAAVYGSAGVGKTTFINYIANMFENSNKVFLANTNPAVDNLQRLVRAHNSTYSTVTKYLSNPLNHEDFLFIDEATTISDRNMTRVLKKTTARRVVLVGDVYQIESIQYGAWFNVLQYFVPESARVLLTDIHRTNDKNLLQLWDAVRNLEDNILELMGQFRFSENLSPAIFESFSKDEIMLCLNYEGLYGVNNINRFLQMKNPESPVHWGIYTFKKGDPILFNEVATSRFSPVLYNNLKATIHSIDIDPWGITFEVVLDKAINEDDRKGDILITGSDEKGNSIISFKVHIPNASDNGDEIGNNHLIPFNLAYAVTIHKAQGLEYESVKIIITNDMEERITHNIFYTAVTRAKKNLKVYWSPESRVNVITNLGTIDNKNDPILIARKHGLKIVRNVKQRKKKKKK